MNHPAAALENARLLQTLEHISAETVLAQAEVERQIDLYNNIRTVAAIDEQSELMLREIMLSVAQTNFRNLQLAAPRPYFTRLDFKEDGEDEIQTHYIGRYGIIKSDTLEAIVADWRSPVANLYYAGQVGPMHYTAPDGDIHGELSLKRQFGIEGGELVSIFDTDVVSQDAYLQAVLGEVSSDRLREVVTTIQAEQNIVIRHPMSSPLIVQGVAGSGKTTIALHRIAYLMYVHQRDLTAKNMMIIAPNPLFLDYISGVLPELGVDDVVQTTFTRLAESLLDDNMPKVERVGLAQLLDLAPDERERLRSVCKIKGSLKFKDALLRFLDEYMASILPDGDIKFGPVVIYSSDELKTFFLRDLSPFPHITKITLMRKNLRRKTKAACQKVIDWHIETCDKRADEIKRVLPDCEERRARLTKLYESRDKRLEETKSEIDPFLLKTMRLFKKPTLTEVYSAFLEWGSEKSGFDAAEWDEVRALTAPALSKKRVFSEDLAPMLLIAQKITGVENMRVLHTVIDEAQDFSAFEIFTLKHLFRSNSFTLVGDLMQGIVAHRGAASWNELAEAIGGAATNELVTSFRNTVEIMTLASRVAQKHPYEGQVPAQPVLRHGPEPVFMKLDEKKRAEYIANQVKKYRDEGFHSITVIEKTPRLAGALYKKLSAIDEGATLLDPDAGNYHGGFLVAAATDIKGLEFDVVILANVNDELFADNLLDARMLYVCMTRPLHRLELCYTGDITPLLT